MYKRQTVSSFDPVRREVARRALAKLIVDGRIHPARIEKLISDATEEVQRDIKEAGEHAAYEANVHGLHPEILKTLGRLKYRTSYGQNQLLSLIHIWPTSATTTPSSARDARTPRSI